MQDERGNRKTAQVTQVTQVTQVADGQAGAGRPKDDLKTLPIAEVEKKLGSPPEGLSDAEAKKRLTQYGPNETAEKKANPLLNLLSYFWGPFPG